MLRNQLILNIIMYHMIPFYHMIYLNILIILQQNILFLAMELPRYRQRNEKSDGVIALLAPHDGHRVRSECTIRILHISLLHDDLHTRFAPHHSRSSSIVNYTEATVSHRRSRNLPGSEWEHLCPSSLRVDRERDHQSS